MHKDRVVVCCRAVEHLLLQDCSFSSVQEQAVVSSARVWCIVVVVLVLDFLAFAYSIEVLVNVSSASCACPVVSWWQVVLWVSLKSWCARIRLRRHSRQEVVWVYRVSLPSHRPDVLVRVVYKFVTSRCYCRVAVNVQESVVASFSLFNANLGDYPVVRLVVSSRASRRVVGFLYSLAYRLKVSVSVRKPVANTDVAEHFFQLRVWSFVALF